jgi:N-acetylneuraminate synthase
MNNKIYKIAEIGINHNGSMEIAKKLISKAYKSGCQAVKFQKRDIESVYTPEELDTPRESPWGTTNRQQKEGLEFNIDQYKELENFSTSLGLDFIVS